MRLDLNPSRRRLAEFTAAMGVAGLVAGALLGVRGGDWLVAGSVAALVVGLALASWFVKPLGRRLYQALTLLAYPFGLVVSFVLLAVVYYLVLTPIGLVRRLMGRDPLARTFDRSASSYWVTHGGRPELSRYFRQD